jgi:hypothetical protein
VRSSFSEFFLVGTVIFWYKVVVLLFRTPIRTPIQFVLTPLADCSAAAHLCRRSSLPPLLVTNPLVRTLERQESSPHELLATPGILETESLKIDDALSAQMHSLRELFYLSSKSATTTYSLQELSNPTNIHFL